MRKCIIAGVLSGALFVLLPGTTAVASPDKDIVNGTIGYNGQIVTMNAQTLSASTTSARGTWTWSNFGFTYSGTVDTLIVEGSIATACGTITASSDPNVPVGWEFQQYVDNTGNGSPHGSGDTSQSFLVDPQYKIPCIPLHDFQADGFGLVNTSGNWYVFDADAS